MLNRLYLDRCFIHQDRTFIFDKGLTAITGRNESGKSLIAEMIRFALFGSKALRGEASDYRRLHVELDFDVKGQSYQVIRKSGNAQLFHDGTMIASGAAVVNKAIPEIFGYDLQVFDTANSCNQGSIEALSNMRPAERKRMVDQTIGLNVLDELLSWVGEQALVSKRLVDTLEPTLEEPIKPLKPKGYRPISELKKTLDVLDDQVATKNRLDGLLANAPEAPGDRPAAANGRTADQLFDDARARRIGVNQIEDLSQKIARCEPPTMTVELIAKMTTRLEAYSAYSDFERRNPRPRYKEEELGRWTGMLMEWADSNQKNLMRDHLEGRLSQMREHLITCPKCSHEFSLDQDKLEKLEAELAELVVPPKPNIESPLSAHDIDQERRFIKAWVGAPDAAADPGYTHQELKHQTSLNELLPQRRGWETTLQDLQSSLPEDIPEELITQLAIWERKYAVHHEYIGAVEAWTVSLKELKGVEQELASVRILFGECSTYETLNKSYETLLVRFDELLQLVEGYRASADAYAAAKVIIQSVKTEIKSLLLPSLNSVASRFLAQMTGGERSIVEIDEDFEILIDGTKLATLSGSGKAVANLAIRLALGQVLTNRVFSVFIADEVDASMDDERAAYTAECLRRLTDLIGQVILITHKHPEADQMLEMSSNGREQRAGSPYTVSIIGRGDAPRSGSAGPPAS